MTIDSNQENKRYVCVYKIANKTLYLLINFFAVQYAHQAVFIPSQYFPWSHLNK